MKPRASFRLARALLVAAGWTVIGMKTDWKRVFAFER